MINWPLMGAERQRTGERRCYAADPHARNRLAAPVAVPRRPSLAGIRFHDDVGMTAGSKFIDFPVGSAHG